jgi:trigger factor
VNDKLKEQVFNALTEQNPIDVPLSLVAREAQKIHDEIYQQQHHDHDGHDATELKAFNSVAQKRVSLGLLIAEYAKQAQLIVDKARVHKRIGEIASVYEKPQEVVNYLANGEQRAGIEAQIMEEQVLEKLMEGIPLTEKTISYAELKGIRI